MAKTVYHIEWMEYRHYSANWIDLYTEMETVETCKELFGIESKDVKTLDDITNIVENGDFSYIKYHPIVTEVAVEIVNETPEINIRTWFT